MPDKKPLIKPKQATSNPQKKPDANVKIENPSLLDQPVYMMAYPHTWDCADPNNDWMWALTPEEIEEDFDKARQQWGGLYNWLSSESSLVYVLPCSGDYPDRIYVANVAVVLLHKPKPIVVVANYKSPPRKGEDKAAKTFFELCEYEVHRPPTHFEGEADCKHLIDDVYCMAHGIRTEKATHQWFEKQFGCKVISIEMRDERNYHLDTVLCPLTPEKVIAATTQMSKEEIAQIEKHMEIIPVPKKLEFAGATNCVRTVNLLLCDSSLPEHKRGSEDWEEDMEKEKFLEKVAVQNGLEFVPVNLSEFEKSGACLSCCVLHMTRAAFSQPVV
jgi:N-dimethylarginine dimethylaminohydrolase